MKTKKLLAVALAAGMLIGGGTKALDLAIPTAYATEEKSLEQLKTELKEAQDKKADLEHKKAFNEKKLAETEKLLEDQTIDWQRRARLKAYKKTAEENLAEINKQLPEVNKQIADLEAKIKNATPAEVFTIEVTTKNPDGSVAKTTVTGKDVEEAKKNVEIAAKKTNYLPNIVYSTDSKTATVTYTLDPNGSWSYNTGCQLIPLRGRVISVSGVKIQVTNNETGEVINNITTGEGLQFFNAKPGNYTISVIDVPTGGVLAGKNWGYRPNIISASAPSQTFTLPTSASRPFRIYELSTVVSRYVDTEGNTIAPDETVELAQPELRSFKPNPKEIEGYRYKELRNEGSLQEGRGTYTYIYEALIYTRFVDPSGNDIAPKEYGIKEFKIIKGYKWIKTEKDEKGNVTHIYLPEYPDDDSTTTTTEETNKDNETKPEDTKPEDKPEDGKDNSDENKAKDLIDKLNKNTAEIEKILKENEANQDKEPDKKPDEKPDKKPEKKPEKDNKGKKSNPKTGVAGISLVAGSLAAASAALVATKKKNK